MLSYRLGVAADVDDEPVSVLIIGVPAPTSTRLLRSSALAAQSVRTCEQALTLLSLTDAAFDVVLLAAPRSRSDGAKDVRRLRATSRETLLFVLMEEAATDASVVEMLELGADDCVLHPLVPAVLAARVRARHRRRVTDSMAASKERPLGDLVVDRSARRCFVNEREVILRAKEFDLLETLASKAGQVVTRTMLMSVVWDEHWSRSTKTLDVTMVGLRRRLREAVGFAGGVVPDIATIRGVGYRMDPVGTHYRDVAYTVTFAP
jgi:DNA-binding response OmpR family regulator